jgi:DNA-binding MarR family transcriptional regulator
MIAGPDAMPTGADASDSEAVQTVHAVRALARISRVLERTSGDLSLAQYRVLAAVDGGDERASRVAHRLALGKPAISAAVDALCTRGLLVRGADASDQRAAALALTTAGRLLLAEVERAMVERLSRICAGTPDPARLIESLTWLGAALDAERAGAGPRAR